ncbi:MAG: hypothetical protein R3181_14170 [Rubricoccaceae bacterium]|nr:hypothetical protein [Rubricoccaceae bacterium]
MTAALVALFLVGSLVLAGVVIPGADPAAAGARGEAPPGKVWSEEHGHWHDAP